MTLNGDNRIDRDEVLAAISDYLFTDSVTRDEVLELISLYLFDSPVAPPTLTRPLHPLPNPRLSLFFRGMTRPCRRKSR